MPQTADRPLQTTINLQKVTQKPFSAYPHQALAWDELDRHFLGEPPARAGVVIVPTGGGKTQLAARWLLQKWVARGGRVLWLSHRRALLAQAFSTFEQAAALAAGGDPQRKELSLILVSGEDLSWSSVADRDDVIFATMQSSATDSAQGFLKRLNRRSGPGLFVVVDEAHHITAPSYRRVLETLNPAEVWLLGLTATPTRMLEQERMQLWNTLGKPVYEIHKQDLIANGILSVPHLVTVETECNFESEFTEAEKDHLKRFGELAESILNKIGNEPRRNGLIVQHYKDNAAKYGKSLIFAVDIAHAITLCEEFRKQGVKADYVASNRGDNESVMARYLDPDGPPVLINVEMLTEGFDAPKTQSVFLVRPTRSEAMLSQMIGRALRGPQADGTEHAYIVSFVDEWKEFDLFHTSWEVITGEVDLPGSSGTRRELLPVPVELILEAYRLVQSRVRGQLLGIFECFPELWYTWSKETEAGLVDRRVLVLDHQSTGFELLRAEFEAGKIPDELDQEQVEEIMSRCFHDCPDPRPRWFDVMELLQAWQKTQEVSVCSFGEKKRFDPYLLALRIYKETDSARQDQMIRDVYDQEPVCQALYGTHTNYYEEVQNYIVQLKIKDKRQDEKTPEVDIPRELPRPWPEGQPGYDLFGMRDLMLAAPAHKFRGNEPTIKKLEYSNKPLPRHWGWCTTDGCILMNCVLNSPDIPRFVVEFVLYHEILHAAMPHAGHNSEFRSKERNFEPSGQAQEEALGAGYEPAQSRDAWRVLAEQFLDTFERFHLWPGREKSMSL